ncbi:MAG: alpha/beta hydrolase [Bdellovibrionota bacterium]
MRKKIRWFFIKGLTREAEHWNQFIDQFLVAFPEVETQQIDLPGSGQLHSQRAPLLMKHVVESIESRIQLEPESYDNYVFAASMGAMAAYKWIHRNPGAFKAAILVNTSMSVVCKPYERFNFRMIKFFPKIIGHYKSYAFRESFIFDATHANKEDRQHVLEQWVDIQRRKPISLWNSISQLISSALFYHPETSKIPILLMRGMGDELVNPSCSEKLKDVWKTELVTHPSGGHNLMHDDPQWVLTHVKQFLASHPSRAT